MDGITQFSGQSPEPLEPTPKPSPESVSFKPESSEPKSLLNQSPLLLPRLPKPPLAAGIQAEGLETKRKTWVWVLLGIIIFVILAISLLVYYGAPPPEETGQLKESENLTTIESELNQVKLNNLESELGDIEKELQ